MADPSSSMAGGAILALAIMIGAGIGAALGQPSAGVVAGTGVGTAIAVIIWRRDRARRGE